MRLRLLSMLVLGLCLCAYIVRAEEAKIGELENLPDNVDPEQVKFLENKQKSRQELMAKRKELEEELADRIKKLDAERQKLDERKTVTVTVDGKEIASPAPRSMEDVLNSVADQPGSHKTVRDKYEVSPEDVNVETQDRWSLNLTDFRIDPPQYVVENRVLKDKKWWGFTFSITNTTPQTRRISPTFVAVTNKGVFNYSVGGFVPERLLANSMQRPLGGSMDRSDKELLQQQVQPLESQVHVMDYAFDPATENWKLAPMMNFEPGQTRWGVALWSNFSDEFTTLQVVVGGLSNAHRYDDKLNVDDKDTEDHRHRIKEVREMVLTFTRNADEFHNNTTLLKYQGKRWEYVWAWDQCINVPYAAENDTQLKIMNLKTPAGGNKVVWAFPFTVNNPTTSNQDFAIKDIAYACNVTVDVGGTKVPVEAHIIDDGNSSIYKRQALQTLGKEPLIKDRFQYTPVEDVSQTLVQRRKVTLEPGKTLDEVWAIFDEADVNWKNLKLQVESALTCATDKKALAAKNWAAISKDLSKGSAAQEKELAQKNPGFLYDPRRTLSEEEFKQVKEQVLKAIPAALEAAKNQKTVTAYFDCASGLSTGRRGIKRCFAKPGAAEADWLSNWDNWMKGWDSGAEAAAPAAP